MKLTDEQKEEIEASIYFDLINYRDNIRDCKISQERKFVLLTKEIIAPAIFKILEKGA